MTDTAGGEMLPVVEQFRSLQGEGYHTGMAVWFIRLGGCDTGCPWCDTDYARDISAARMTAVEELARRAKESETGRAVITGGEPSMHTLEALTSALHRCGMEIFVETAGTHPLRGEFDWVCLSPKSVRGPLPEVYALADELKMVIACEEDFARAEECAAKVRSGCRLFLQPEWNSRVRMLPAITEYIACHPSWRLSLQTHKYIDIR